MFDTTFTPKKITRASQNLKNHPLRASHASANWYEQARLSEIEKRYPDLPPKSIILGVSEDEWPVLIDFADPGTKPIVILGDSHSGKTHLLKIILQSAINQADHAIQLAVIDPNHQLNNLLKQAEEKELCLFNTHDQIGDIRQKVLELAERTEQRHGHPKQADDILLIIDGLDIVQSLDMDTKHSLEWLIKYGPHAHVWPIVSLDSQKATNFSRWIRLFPMRLLTHMPERLGHRFGLYEGINTNQILPRKQFSVHLPNGWLTFWVPQRP